MKTSHGVIMIALIAAPVPGVAKDQNANAVVTDITNRFVSAFNHRDAGGIATLFSEDGVRLGQKGVLKGREAIGEELETIFRAGPVDFSVKLGVVQPIGNSIWYSFAWFLTQNGRHVSGYDSQTLVPKSNGYQIVNQTVAITPPGQQDPSK